MKILIVLFLSLYLNVLSQNVHYQELFNINTVTNIEKIQAFASEINVCAFSIDERYLASFDMLFNFHIWDIANNRIKNYLTDTIHPFVIYDLEYTKNQKLLIAAGDEIRIYETQKYHMLKRIFTTPVFSVATGNRFFFTSGEDGIIRMWDINTLTVIDSADNKQATWSLRLSNSENKLYAGSTSGFVKVYEVNAFGKIHLIDSIKAFDESQGIRKHDITDIDISDKDDYLYVNPDINNVYIISIVLKSITKSFVNPEESAVLSIRSLGNGNLVAALESNKMILYSVGEKIQPIERHSFFDCNIKDYLGSARVTVSRGRRYIAFANGMGVIHVLERK